MAKTWLLSSNSPEKKHMFRFFKKDKAVNRKWIGRMIEWMNGWMDGKGVKILNGLFSKRESLAFCIVD